MSNGSYVAFLVIGVMLVAVDGQVIYRGAVRYLANSYTEKSPATSLAKLVAVLFHLAVLGVLALISVIDVDGGGAIQTVVLRLGVLLLVVALAHGVTIAVLNRMRDRLDAEELTIDRIERHRTPTASGSGPKTITTLAADGRVPTDPGSSSATSPKKPLRRN